jgi:hypothetical protein
MADEFEILFTAARVVRRARGLRTGSKLAPVGQTAVISRETR